MNAPPRDLGPVPLAEDAGTAAELECVGPGALARSDRATVAEAPLPPADCLYLRARATGVLVAVHQVSGAAPSDLRLWFAPAAETLPALRWPALVALLDAHARGAGAATMRLQQKIPAGGRLAAILSRHGFHAGEVSVAHELAVDAAGTVLDRLAFPAARLCRLAPGSLAAAALPELRTVLEREQLMDGIELDARGAMTGPGGVVLCESPAVYDGSRLAGFVLVARAARPDARELVARWVHPEAQGLSLVNLSLMRDCLARARASGIATARFRANPGRHADTMALARRIAAREVDRLAGFERRIPETAPGSGAQEEPR
ncbi:MAG: hypothetical protein ACFBSD_13205 [Paracoccaceae bacterium]